MEINFCCRRISILLGDGALLRLVVVVVVVDRQQSQFFLSLKQPRGRMGRKEGAKYLGKSDAVRGQMSISLQISCCSAVLFTSRKISPQLSTRDCVEMRRTETLKNFTSKKEKTITTPLIEKVRLQVDIRSKNEK